MTAKPANNTNPQGLVDSLQSEVASEASPLLNALINNARFIVMGLVLFLVAIAGYWIYSSQAQKQTQADLRALGEILVISDPAKRLERLEAYAPGAPGSVRHQAWFSVMEAATELGKHDKAFDAWKVISEFGGEMKATGCMGMANSLAAQGKLQEAVDLLASRVSGFSGQEALNMQQRIASLAEAAGDTKRALAACDAIINAPEASDAAKIWRQKRASLAQSPEAGGAGGAAPKADPASGS